MLTTSEIMEHRRFVESARNICRTLRIKSLWTWVLFGATGTAVVEGYTLRADPDKPARLFSLSVPTSGKNLVQALIAADVWEPDVIGVAITTVTTSDLWLLPCANKDFTWSVSGNTKMSSIIIGNYDTAEVLVNMV